jgi:hypothetical protein
LYYQQVLVLIILWDAVSHMNLVPLFKRGLELPLQRAGCHLVTKGCWKILEAPTRTKTYCREILEGDPRHECKSLRSTVFLSLSTCLCLVWIHVSVVTFVRCSSWLFGQSSVNNLTSLLRHYCHQKSWSSVARIIKGGCWRKWKFLDSFSWWGETVESFFQGLLEYWTQTSYKNNYTNGPEIARWIH